MPLQVRLLEAADFQTLSRYIHHEGGDLIAPLVPMIWLISKDDAANTKRNEWSLRQQEDIYREDPTVHFMKVIDTDAGDEIISLARWHFYPEGYKHAEMGAWELNGTAADADKTWPKEINVPLAKALLEGILCERHEWQIHGPQWSKSGI